MARVSVIVPTFNRANLLPETVSSVLGQTFSDLELLIIDDGSTDDTAKVVDQISDSRIKFIRQPHSGLPAVARNTGLRHADSDYIAFIDSDDLWLPGKLDHQVRHMDSSPEVGLIHSNAYAFSADPSRHHPHPIHPPSEGLSGSVFERLYGRPSILNLTVMIRSEVPVKVGLFDEDIRLKANEDYEYWLRVAERYPFGYIDRPLALYRQHQGGISKDAVATSRAKLFLIEKLDHMYPEHTAHLSHTRQRWMAAVENSLGRGLLREGKMTAARRHLLRSLRLSLKPSPFLFWCCSLFGKGFCNLIDGRRTQIARQARLRDR